LAPKPPQLSPPGSNQHTTTFQKLLKTSKNFQNIPKHSKTFQKNPKKSKKNPKKIQKMPMWKGSWVLLLFPQ
jgi:hypothetical protein